VQQLIPYNPVDQLRLLKWLFLTPQMYKQYTEQHHSLRGMGTWLSSTLTWLPLLIAAIGYTLGTVPPSFVPGPALIVMVLVGWGLTGWLGRQDVNAESILLGVVAFLLALGVAYFVVDRLSVGVVIVAAAVMARGVAVVAALGRASSVAGGVAVGMAVSTAVLIVGGLEGGIQVIVGGAVAIIISLAFGYGVTRIINKNIEQGESGWRSKLVFVGLIASYAGLIWLYILGGWSVLQ
jgi:hypothetical protein